MTSYSKEVIADLIEGNLPWHDTRRIMSAYKDDDRFDKAIAALQDRVEWDAPIILPVSSHLFIADTAKGRHTLCECGHDFGHWTKNWKLSAAVLIRDSDELLAEIYPTADLPDPRWMELREFICPTCGHLHEVEACAPGYPVVHDFQPDLEGFYEDWLGRALPPEPGVAA
ncbi:MAG: acetone carboxylase subunit gamma [Rubellimicrobium sp.]|nr:acetone carboxylase subunit gamma [Rubellimicrobium sp.]